MEFQDNAGNLGEAGCVGWMFDKKGYISVDLDKASEEQLMEWSIDAGASDFSSDGGIYEIFTEYADLESVRSALEQKGGEMVTAEITMTPQSTVKIEGKQAEQMIRLFEALEDHEDVQKVYANFDIDETVLEELSEQ